MIAEAPFVFSIAALSVTLAGFAGLVAAFRRGSEWNPVDVFRLRELDERGLGGGRAPCSASSLFWAAPSF